MIWIGMAIGIIFTSCFGMALLVIVSKQKTEAMPKQLIEFWEKSLMNQRNLFHATASIADALEERNAPNIDKIVDRFLCWNLPEDFAPDCGITFDRAGQCNPVGTNLFTATQARQLFEHVLKD